MKSPVILLLWLLPAVVLSKCLLREPPDISTPPQQTDAGFFVDISGDPKIYEPGHLYTVSLRVRVTFQTLKGLLHSWWFRLYAS